MTVMEFLTDLFDQYGNQKYADEEVTQTQHAVQSGLLARDFDAEDSVLVTAALLHDVGHLLVQADWPSSLDDNLDDKHEEVGCEYLVEHFGPEVAEPVRLHVAAKRYLCTVDPNYQEELSPTSFKSFLDQGGKMSEAELAEFRENPNYERAIRLRRWDDTAKATEMPSLGVADFAEEIQAAAEIWQAKNEKAST